MVANSSRVTNRRCPAERDQLANPMAVTGDRECLSALDGVHDLPGPVAQVALSDL
jgi:hypothetical protein